MQTLMVYSEAGGVNKTTTAVSIAMAAALNGQRVTLIDLDPRAAATKWTRATPAGEGLHVGAILGAADGKDTRGWAEDLAVPIDWHHSFRVVPSDRSVSNYETLRVEDAELRLMDSLDGLDADVVVIDCANRQGGLLTRSAMLASDSVLYAASAADSGVDGVSGAQRSVTSFKRSQERRGVKSELTELGTVVTRFQNGFLSLSETDAIEQIREFSPIIEPIVPKLAIVPEARLQQDWYGRYRKGSDVLDAYKEIARKVIR